MEPLPKPDALLALHGVTEELFDTLRVWFDVPERVTLSLEDVDSAVAELADPVLVAALAMRKLQALRLLAQPGVRTSTDVVVSIVQDLDRALLHAPALHLERRARLADWDAAFEALVESGGPAGEDEGAGADGGEEDAEVQAFRALHGRLHEAAQAVVEASEGRIRYFV
ncbi:hypothetical protein [Egicoccus halophilus]|uniref:Uncharacterized protein n=1 Tax=Egicoccus halophilus TaxID=1670830 RepID=A0A8J3ET28_9ACTN|nr:hypothetical protein [Egicoccus halophilus]GGI04755.1 hypothetical protein GCM10011354_10680 [Egicoccus halophilus]